MSNPNANVRMFLGPINAAAYWIGDHLLRAGDIVNDSSVSGTTVKAALNTLSSTVTTSVFPYIGTSLAEQDILSYDASAAVWRNRTKVAALKGQGKDSFAVGTGALAAGANDISLGTSAGNLSFGSNVAIGSNVLRNAASAWRVVGIGLGALNGALTYDAASTVAIGEGALGSLTSGDKNVAIGFGSSGSITTQTDNTSLGYSTLGNNSTGSNNTAMGALAMQNSTSASSCTAVGSSAGSTINANFVTCIGASSNSSSTAIHNTFVGYATGGALVGSQNTAVGSLAFNNASVAVTDCVAIGYNALAAIISNTSASGSVGIGSGALSTLTAGAKNVAVGQDAGNGITTANNCTFVGSGQIIGNNSNQTLLGANINVTASGTVAIGAGAQTSTSDVLVIRMGANSAKELLITPVTDATARAASTYLPIKVGATQYYIPLYT